MICVETLAMPSVFARCQPVEVGFMCDGKGLSTANAPADPAHIVVLGGATGTADSTLAASAQQLARAGFEVATPISSQLGRSMPGAKKLSDFRFDDESFAWADVILARPGSGIITDAVCRGIPMVFAYESGNSELRQNAQAMAHLGIGRDAGPDPEPWAVVEEVQTLLQPDEWQAAKAKGLSATKDGIDRAVEWLMTTLQNPALAAGTHNS